MSVGTLFGSVGVVIGVLVLGIGIGWAWKYTGHSDPDEQMAKRINLGLAVFFTMVAIMVAVDLVTLQVKFNKYVTETLPRDTAQEKCNTATIEVLKAWVIERHRRDDAVDARDEAGLKVLDGFVSTGAPNADDVQAWRNAIAAAIANRDAGPQITLPTC